MLLSLDIAWVLLSASLVFLMQAGFLCLEAGTTRRKNNISVALKNLTDLGVSIIIFWSMGYGLMFGLSLQGWMGQTQFFPNMGQGNAATIAFFLFQAMFCSTAVTILSGAVAERMSFKGYLLIACVISGVLYPVFGHWVWNGLNQSATSGWLESRGFIDFAGSSVVHSLGGWMALAAVLVIGPRLGRFSKKRVHNIPRSDTPLALLGTLLLWFGWFGFNGGSTLALNGQVPGILANTLLAGAAGMTVPLLWLLIWQDKVSVTLIMNGAIAGLVSITANCHAVSSFSALIIGSVGGLIMLLLDWALIQWHIDDAVGAIPVHLGAGVWGTLAVAMFSDLEALGTGLGRLEQLKVQLSGVLACGLWAFGGSLMILLLLNRWGTLRVTHRQEYLGLNIAVHGEHSEFNDLYMTMKEHAQGALSRRAEANSFTEIGQISGWYNQVVQALERATTKTNAIITTAVDGILTVTPGSLTIQSANPAIEKIFGYEAGSLIGQPVTRLMGDDATLEHIEDAVLQEEQKRAYAIALLQQGNQTGNVLDAVGFHKHGHPIPLEITTTVSASDSHAFWTILIRDVTARKTAEAALHHAEFTALAERRQKEELKIIVDELKWSQAQLLQTEKMTSLGRLV